MKISFVTPEFITEDNYDGGLSNYLAKVGLGLKRLGHEVCIIVRSHTDEKLDWQGLDVYRVKIAGPPVPFLNNLLREYRQGIDCLWQSWKLNRSVAKINEQVKFDIIQYTSYTATGLFRIKCAPSVVRLSSYDPLLREAYGVKADLPRRLLEFIEKLAIKKSDAVFSPSQLLSKVAGERLKVPVDVIHSPFAEVSGTREHQPYLDLLKGKRYLLFFGTLGVLKGVGTIGEIIRPLLENHPDLFFVFVGKDAGFRGQPIIQEVWTQAGPSRGRVLYLGKMRQNQLVPIIENSLAAILPSHIDNFPNTCVEAMAAGRVVVGTRGTSFEELLEDGVSGFLAEPDNSSDLKEKIETVLGLDAMSLDRMGQKAKEGAAELSGDLALLSLVSFFEKVIDARKSQRDSS
jgi:glycosyltransferase involved in cell wall biosynthesis